MNPKPLGILLLTALSTMVVYGEFEESKTYSWGPNDFKAQVTATIKGDTVGSISEYNSSSRILKSISGSVAASAHIFGKDFDIAKVGYEWEDGSGEWITELGGNIVDVIEIGDFSITPAPPPELSYSHTFVDGSMVFWVAGIPITLSYEVGGNWGPGHDFKPKNDGGLSGLTASISGNASIVANATAAVSVILIRGGVGLDVTLFDTTLTARADLDWKHAKRLFVDLDLSMRPWSTDLYLFYQTRVWSWTCWGCRWGSRNKWSIWTASGTLSRWSLYQDWSYLVSDPEFEPLVNNLPQTISTDVENNGQLFAIDLPTGPIKAIVSAQGGNGDVNLYLSQGEFPDPDAGDHQFASKNSGNSETVTLIGNFTQANQRFYALAHAEQAYENTELLTSISTAQTPVARIASQSNYVYLQFDGSNSSEGEGPLVTYHWDFGDGHTGLGIDVNHTYTATGIYLVSLTVTDIYGISHTTQTEIGIQEFIILGPSSIQANTNHTWTVPVTNFGPGPYSYAWSYKTDCGGSGTIDLDQHKGPSCNVWHPAFVNSPSITIGNYFSHNTQLRVEVTNATGQVFLGNKTVYTHDIELGRKQ